MTSEIETCLAEFIQTKILKRKDYRVEPEDRLISSGLVDSFHLIDLALFVEEQFGARIEDTELNADTFDTITELARFIIKKQT
jgi:D-alanine--poly(phosphoribitol) ligase subunit 2